MYSIKEQFINECTAQGYIKANKRSSKKYKFWIRFYIIFIVIQVLVLVKFGFFKENWVYFIYFDMMLFLPIYVLAINGILAELEIKDFKRYRIMNKKVGEYFQVQKEFFMTKLFMSKDKSINYDKLDYYIKWCEEMESSNKFEGLFEKAIIAGLTLPMWNKFVDLYLDEIGSYSASEFNKFVLILLIFAVIVFFTSLILKNSIAVMYLEYHNSDSEEYKNFKRALRDYYGKKKFN